MIDRALVRGDNWLSIARAQQATSVVTARHNGRVRVAFSGGSGVRDVGTVASYYLGECERAWLCAGFVVIQAYVNRPGYLIVDEPDLPFTLVMVLPVWLRPAMRDYMFGWVIMRIGFEQDGLVGVVRRLREMEATFHAMQPPESAAD